MALVVYGADWCPDCRRSKELLLQTGTAFTWIDTDADEAGKAHIRELQGGEPHIPTIVFEDGSFLVEPTDQELAAKLGVLLPPQQD
ncbi:glutaredoxin domain-containing protein [Ferrimicrobium sp.]|uniref:glutaredoxin domain-containing protein n=1 Tax=Ferrimicrobium sp. TaxID=2926050 RepID=UPI0026372CF0|nr:glutaredoxin domain-containing protein [Ferrimicrobium sp.]